MFGKNDVINDLLVYTIQLLCNVHVTFGWFQFGEIVFIYQIRQIFPHQTFLLYGIPNHDMWPDFGKPTIYTQETNKIITSISSDLKYNFG